MKYVALILLLALIATGVGLCRATRSGARARALPHAPPASGADSVRAGGSRTDSVAAAPVKRRRDAEAEAIEPGPLELYATYSSVGIELPYAGDANSNATAAFVWRRQGEAGWRPGIEMTVDRGRRRIWASLWPLDQGATVEVKVTLSDPDPFEPSLAGNATTRRPALTNRAGRVVFVAAEGGKDTNPGTAAAPFKTIGHAVEGAKAGDTILVRSGVYHESVSLGAAHQGQPDRPIVIMAARDELPVMNGAEEIPRGGAFWSRVVHTLYVAAADFGEAGTGYVDMDGKCMYPYRSLEALARDEFETARAFFYDRSGRRLYVRLNPADAPTPHVVAYATLPCAFNFDGARHVVIRGFEVRGYGTAGIIVSGASAGNILLENRIHNVPRGVWVRAAAADTAIWSNEVFEKSLADFSPAAIDQLENPGDGILAEKAGRGTSICRNKVYGLVNGIVLESRECCDRLELNRDSDLMFNTVFNMIKAAVALRGGGVNVRCHGNAIRNANTALGLAPIERGPLYVTRNEASYRSLMFDGCSPLPSEGWTYCCNNSGYTILVGNESTMVRFSEYSVPDRNRVFLNNAIVGSEWSVQCGRGPGHSLDYNCYFNTPETGFRKFQWNRQVYSSFASFQAATGQETHGLYADPRFSSTPDMAQVATNRLPKVRDASVGDLHPREDSPLIDGGYVIPGVTDGFKGRAPDIGAHETGE